MTRLIRWARRVAGAAVIAWGAWQIARPIVKRWRDPRAVSVGRDAFGRPVAIRTRPLDAQETRAALAAEQEQHRAAWAELVGPIGLEP